MLCGRLSGADALRADTFYVWAKRAGPAGDGAVGGGSAGGFAADTGGLADKKPGGEPWLHRCIHGGLGPVGLSGLFPQSAPAAGGERSFSPMDADGAGADGPPAGSGAPVLSLSRVRGDLSGPPGEGNPADYLSQMRACDGKKDLKKAGRACSPGLFRALPARGEFYWPGRASRFFLRAGVLIRGWIGAQHLS